MERDKLRLEQDGKIGSEFRAFVFAHQGIYFQFLASVFLFRTTYGSPLGHDHANDPHDWDESVGGGGAPETGFAGPGGEQKRRKREHIDLMCLLTPRGRRITGES